MPWIESHTLLIGHRKVIELSQALRLRPAYALGHLHALWHAVLDQAEDGDISSWSDELIALKSDFPGSAPQYVRLLHCLRLLDGDPGDDGSPRRLLVHDWLDYAGKFLRGKYSRRRDKLVAIWAKHGKEYGVSADKQPTESRPNADQQPTSWLGTVVLPSSLERDGGAGEGKTFPGVGYATPEIRAAAERVVDAYQESTATANDPRGGREAVIRLLMTGEATEEQLAKAAASFGAHARKTYAREKRLSARYFFGGDAPAWAGWVNGTPIRNGVATSDDVAARVLRQRQRIADAKSNVPEHAAKVLARLGRD